MSPHTPASPLNVSPHKPASPHRSRFLYICDGSQSRCCLEGAGHLTSTWSCCERRDVTQNEDKKRTTLSTLSLAQPLPAMSRQNGHFAECAKYPGLRFWQKDFMDSACRKNGSRGPRSVRSLYCPLGERSQ